MADLADKPRSELSELELQQLEEYEFSNGPMSLLKEAVETHSPVIISCRNNHKLIARIKAFDRHTNMVLENVKELWTEIPRNSHGKKLKPISKERFVSKMFLRGDSVIVVFKAPVV
ncbi:mRNA splicing protein SMD2 [Ascoidea rubescens DSM 1968]|uniref:Small nuclear ribonucleoprotein Sm D2 n=1 Tax=Ascoidea rubescens DSM 1968 TaxID=1344418 RepID=A0A1D2VFG7_9ASCO|nr:small nuclear ribonucleo protein Sm D2 [Ascoidea rubescens DSM 1968]ODV60376.1 small nuclear ribonucleo protein Sm D2 [Ascoidea rubescens DSM 1968]